MAQARLMHRNHRLRTRDPVSQPPVLDRVPYLRSMSLQIDRLRCQFSHCRPCLPCGSDTPVSVRVLTVGHSFLPFIHKHHVSKRVTFSKLSLMISLIARKNSPISHKFKAQRITISFPMCKNIFLPMLWSLNFFYLQVKASKKINNKIQKQKNCIQSLNDWIRRPCLVW